MVFAYVAQQLSGREKGTTPLALQVTCQVTWYANCSVQVTCQLCGIRVANAEGMPRSKGVLVYRLHGASMLPDATAWRLHSQITDRPHTQRQVNSCCPHTLIYMSPYMRYYISGMQLKSQCQETICTLKYLIELKT